MMKILLYDTGDTRNELNEPLGIEVLAAHIKKKYGNEVVLDLSWYNSDKLPKKLDGYDLIGISLNINRLEVFGQIYHSLKKLENQCIMLVGNVTATYGYEHLLSIYHDIICVVGEGEESIVQIIDGIKNQTLNLEDIPNLAYVEKNETYVTHRKIVDLEGYLLPMRHFTDFIIKNNGLIRLEGSRGCAWNRCNFCSVAFKYNDTNWRSIGLDIIFQQIVDLNRNGVKSFYFTDEDFIGNDILRFERMIDGIYQLRLSKAIKKEVNFFISIKPTDMVNEKIYHLLKRFIEVGLNEIFIGLESGCNPQIKRYNKCTSKEINKRALIKAEALDVNVDIGFIMFDPKMTLLDLMENISFVEENELYQYGANIIKRLRVQNYTRYKDEFNLGDLNYNLDRLEYEYHFNDPFVELIYHSYFKLNLDKHSYQLQNSYRGEASSIINKNLSKEKLIDYRKLQFDLLKIITQNVIESQTDDMFDMLNKTKEITCLRTTNSGVSILIRERQYVHKNGVEYDT